MKNYYKILGVSGSADYDTIKKAYRSLAKECHPDLHPGDKTAEDRFKEISEAWEILGDAEKRKAYDLELSGQNKKTSQQRNPSSKARTAPVGKIDLEEMMRNFSSTFSEDTIKNEAEKKNAKKDPFNSDEMFKKFMGFK